MPDERAGQLLDRPRPPVEHATLRVAILGPARFPVAEPFAGGMEMHTYTLATELAARGHDVTVYAAAGARAGSFHVETMLPVATSLDPDLRRDVLGGPDVERSEHRSYLDALRRLAASHHDVVHVNAVHHVPFGHASTLPGIVTGTLHTPPEPWLAAAVTSATRQVKPIQLACVSATNALAWAPLVDAVRVIANGVDLRRWRCGPGGDGAVWTGRLVPEKAPHLAIDAARLAGVPLRLMGPIHDPAYFRRVVQPRLGDDVEYVGHASIAELVVAVGSASVAVVTPTWDEPFGLVVAEALACGTPVAGFASGALPELLDHTTGVLAPADDVARLAQAMVVASNLRRADCRARAARLFSVERMVDDYESWFVELVAALP